MRKRNPISILRKLGAAKFKISQAQCRHAGKKAYDETKKTLDQAGCYDDQEIRHQCRIAFRVAYSKTMAQLIKQQKLSHARKPFVQGASEDQDLNPIKVTHEESGSETAHEMDTVVYFNHSAESPGSTTGDPRITKKMLHLKPKSQRRVCSAYPREDPDFE